MKYTSFLRLLIAKDIVSSLLFISGNLDEYSSEEKSILLISSGFVAALSDSDLISDFLKKIVNLDNSFINELFILWAISCCKYSNNFNRESNDYLTLEYLIEVLEAYISRGVLSKGDLEAVVKNFYS